MGTTPGNLFHPGSPDGVAVAAPAASTEIASAAAPGGTHLLTEENGALRQQVHDPAGTCRLSEFVRHLPGTQDGDTVGLATVSGSVPAGLVFWRKMTDSSVFRVEFTGSDGIYVVTIHRRVWPGIPTGVEMLTSLKSAHTPELVAVLETAVHGESHVLGTIVKIPLGINTFDYARQGVRAQVFSHDEGVLLGQTLRYLHDTLLMAHPYAWIPTVEVRIYLEQRLDTFVEASPVIAAHAPWIRKIYRSLDGEMLIQRIHGGLSLHEMWIHEGDWVIGRWDGELSRPPTERGRIGSPLSDLAALQRSLSWACDGDHEWCFHTMSSIFEGYGEPMKTLPFCSFVLDKACQEIANHVLGGREAPPLVVDFLGRFRENLLPDVRLYPASEFLRPGSVTKDRGGPPFRKLPWQ